jgi:hypothetical protein
MAHRSPHGSPQTALRRCVSGSIAARMSTLCLAACASAQRSSRSPMSPRAAAASARAQASLTVLLMARSVSFPCKFIAVSCDVAVYTWHSQFAIWKAGKPGDLHLDVDRAGLDFLKGYGRNPLDHAIPCFQSKVAEAGYSRKNVARTNIVAPPSGVSRKRCLVRHRAAARTRIGKVDPKRNDKFRPAALGISQGFFCKPVTMPEDSTSEWGEGC